MAPRHDGGGGGRAGGGKSGRGRQQREAGRLGRIDARETGQVGAHLNGVLSGDRGTHALTRTQQMSYSVGDRGRTMREQEHGGQRGGKGTGGGRVCYESRDSGHYVSCYPRKQGPGTGLKGFVNDAALCRATRVGGSDGEEMGGHTRQLNPPRKEWQMEQESGALGNGRFRALALQTHPPATHAHPHTPSTHMPAMGRSAWDHENESDGVRNPSPRMHPTRMPPSHMPSAAMTVSPARAPADSREFMHTSALAESSYRHEWTHDHDAPPSFTMPPNSPWAPRCGAAVQQHEQSGRRRGSPTRGVYDERDRWHVERNFPQGDIQHTYNIRRHDDRRGDYMSEYTAGRRGQNRPAPWMGGERGEEFDGRSVAFNLVRGTNERGRDGNVFVDREYGSTGRDTHVLDGFSRGVEVQRGDDGVGGGMGGEREGGGMSGRGERRGGHPLPPAWASHDTHTHIHTPTPLASEQERARKIQRLGKHERQYASNSRGGAYSDQYSAPAYTPSYAGAPPPRW